jgi:hypothetical protein
MKDIQGKVWHSSLHHLLELTSLFRVLREIKTQKGSPYFLFQWWSVINIVYGLFSDPLALFPLLQSIFMGGMNLLPRQF